MESVKKERFEEDIIIKLVKEKRKNQPKIGVRKLYSMLREDFNNLGFHVGRDKLFATLGKYGLLVERMKRFVKTTNSNHWYMKYKNLIKDLMIVRPNQVFIADITYIRIKDTFMFLSLITDYFSRKIVGYKLNDDLSAAGPISALKMALRGVRNKKGLIHHSDRGIQYGCTEYTEILNDHEIRISMTEENHVYENAVAERINGILKDEFLLGMKFNSKEIAQQAVEEAVRIYNTERPHFSIGLSTPAKKYAA
jgi:putative transposase